MKKTIQFLSLAVLMVGFFGCAKKSDPDPKYFIIPTYYDQQSGGATFSVSLYNTEADFLAGGTPVFQTNSASSSSGGGVFIEIPLVGQTAYYVHVKSTNGLTNRRELIRNPFMWAQKQTGDPGFVYLQKFNATQTPYLTSNPVKLKVSVTAGGNPVSGATVTLYESLADYQSNTPFYSKPTYLSYILSYYTNIWKIDPKTIFYGTTDASGNYTFTELEPKEYWVKVSQGLLNNNAGVIKTTTALPDDIKATTTLNITLQ